MHRNQTPENLLGGLRRKETRRSTTQLEARSAVPPEVMSKEVFERVWPQQWFSTTTEFLVLASDHSEKVAANRSSMATTRSSPLTTTTRKSRATSTTSANHKWFWKKFRASQSSPSLQPIGSSDSTKSNDSPDLFTVSSTPVTTTRKSRATKTTVTGTTKTTVPFWENIRPPRLSPSLQPGSDYELTTPWPDEAVVGHDRTVADRFGGVFRKKSRAKRRKGHATQWDDDHRADRTTAVNRPNFGKFV